MVSDMDQAIEFYTNKLGLELANRYWDHYAEVQAAELIIGLHPKSDKITFGTNISIGFGVGEFDQTIQNLEKEGIEFKIQEEGFIRLASFADPDGNSLFLAENKE